MILGIHCGYRDHPGRPGYELLDVSVDRHDIPLWWRRPKPWAQFEVSVPRVRSSNEGLVRAIAEIAERLSIRDFGLDYEDEFWIRGFGDVGTVTTMEQAYEAVDEAA